MSLAPRPFIPHTYQRLIIDHQCNHPRNAVWAGMGLGKTASTLATIGYLDSIHRRKTLIIAPLRVARSTWIDEADKWADFAHMKAVPIVGNPSQRLQALRQDASVFTINYENVPWLVHTLGRQWDFSRVVVDESTRLKSFRLRGGSQRAKALASVAHSKVAEFFELTGTPSPNGLEDLWGQAWFLDKGQRLGSSYNAFIQRWFDVVKVGQFTRTTPRPKAAEQISQALSDLCLSVRPEDWFDLNEPIVKNVYVDMPPQARAQYEKLWRDMVLELDKMTAVEAVNAAARTLKCLQLASGALYVDENDQHRSWVEVHDRKIQALEIIMRKARGAPILVAYHFQSDLERLLKAFPQGRVLDSDPQTLRDWNAGRIPILFAHPASAGHGLNLQDGGNILVFFSHWWDLEQYQQIVERIGPVRQKQAGHHRPVFIYHIIALDTVDELVIQRRHSKESIQALILKLARSKTCYPNP